MSLAQDTFISSLYWTDKIGPASTIATIKKIIDKDVPTYNENLGKKIQSIWLSTAKANKIKIKITGPVPQLSIFAFDYTNSLYLKTLFIQEMLGEGFLTTTAFYPSFAHNDTHLDKYQLGLDKTFAFLKKRIEKNDVEKYLKGPVCHDGFRRLT